MSRRSNHEQTRTERYRAQQQADALARRTTTRSDDEAAAMLERARGGPDRAIRDELFGMRPLTYGAFSDPQFVPEPVEFSGLRAQILNHVEQVRSAQNISFDEARNMTRQQFEEIRARNRYEEDALREQRDRTYERMARTTLFDQGPPETQPFRDPQPARDALRLFGCNIEVEAFMDDDLIYVVRQVIPYLRPNRSVVGWGDFSEPPMESAIERVMIESQGVNIRRGSDPLHALEETIYRIRENVGRSNINFTLMVSPRTAARLQNEMYVRYGSAGAKAMNAARGAVVQDKTPREHTLQKEGQIFEDQMDMALSQFSA